MERIFLTSFIGIMIPTYTYSYGLQNFLWLSDISLFLICLALWYESALLISITALLSLAMELLWCLDYFHHLFTGSTLLSMTEYMFDNSLSLFIRGLSFFHFLLPFFCIKYLLIWGYDKRAIYYAVPILWLVLMASYMVSTVDANVNWIYQPTVAKWDGISTTIWLGVQFLLYPLLIMLPKSVIYRKMFIGARC